MNYKIESKFEHKGLPCKIIFMATGYRCGYVGVPRTHPFYKKSYDDLFNIKVHGDLTFSGFHNYNLYEEFNPNTDYWWFGFDCAHLWSGDAIDLKSMQEYGFINKSDYREVERALVTFAQHGAVRTLEFCVKECMKLADQLYKYRWEI